MKLDQWKLKKEVEIEQFSIRIQLSLNENIIQRKKRMEYSTEKYSNLIVFTFFRSLFLLLLIFISYRIHLLLNIHYS